MGRGLKVIGFSNVSPMKDRHGKIRYRFRKKGFPTVYLPGLPGSPEFAAAYVAVTTGAPVEPGASRTASGSMNALAVTAYASAEWKALSPSTRSNYKGVMERLRKDYGALPLAGLNQAFVLKLRDRIEGKAAQNNFIKALRWFMAFAISRKLRADDPTAGIKKIKYQTEGYHTWTEDEVQRFETCFPIGTKQRLAMDLLLYTGQRSADVRMMGRQHISGDGIRVKQSKTGAELTIPIHPNLAASLATVPAAQMMFLPTIQGPTYSPTGFYNWLKRACRKAGVPECSPHGLRKCILTRLADAGCSESQMMAISGHKNSKEVETYIRARDQRRLAAAALATIETNGEQKMANPANRLANSPSKARKG